MDVAIKVMLVIVVLAMVLAFSLLILVFAKPDFFSKYKEKVVSADDVKSPQEQNKGYNMGKVGDTKSFIPVEGFEDFAMDLGHHNYRAIIECTSLNYGLMSMQEQDMVEKSFMRFLNTLSFPIEIYIQTREFDKELVLEKLHDNIRTSSKRFSTLSSYANQYEQQMQYLTDYIGNSKVKKKYIIVPFDNTDLLDVSALNNYEIKQFALEELMGRCQIVMGGISGVGITPTLLDRKGIAECLYSYYHRDFYRIARDILAGDFTTLAVNSETPVQITDRSTLDAILTEAQNRIKNDMVHSDSEKEELVFYQYIVDVLESFKQDGRGEGILDLLNRTWEAAEQNGNISEYNQFLKNREDLKSFLSEGDPDGYVTPTYPYASPDVANPNYYDPLYTNDAPVSQSVINFD